MNTVIRASSLFTPQKIIHNAYLTIEDGIITDTGKRNGKSFHKSATTNYGKKIITPGFIDIHTHGGFGVSFGVGDLSDGLAEYCQKAPTSGVTGFLLTLTAPDAAMLAELVSQYAAILDKPFKGARPLGLHLEGPYLNPEKKGAFRAEWLHTPDLDDLEKIIRVGKGWVRQITLAPELPNAINAARFLRWHGVTAALGHSNADFETAHIALAGDFTHVTHTYNAQSSFNHRNPGVIGAVLTSRTATAELIADGHHVHPAAVKLLVNSVDKERVVLVTDAIAGAGLPDGNYQLMDEQITVQNGAARLADGTLAGSTALMNDCVRNAAAFSGISLRAAVKMASQNPAKAVGLAAKTGSLECGRKADFIILDDRAKVEAAYVNGNLVFSKSGGVS